MVLIFINSNFVMRISLLGTGKTGRIFQNLAVQAGHVVDSFNTSYRPDVDSLGESDLIVCFVPGHTMPDIIPLLVTSGQPVLNGATGFDWPGSRDEFSNELIIRGLKWLSTGNFSPGCNLAMQLIRSIQYLPVSDGFDFTLTETHHVHKKDAPSGTALMWRDALGINVEIRSVRESDVAGIHEIRIGNKLESVTIRHEVLDRSVFANGTLRVAEWMHRNLTALPAGLHDVHELMRNFQHLK